MTWTHSWLKHGHLIQQRQLKTNLVSQIAVIGENMNIRRFKKIESDGVVASYIHGWWKDWCY